MVGRPPGFGYAPLRPSVCHLSNGRKGPLPLKPPLKYLHELLQTVQMNLPCDSAVPRRRATGGSGAALRAEAVGCSGILTVTLAGNSPTQWVP